MKNKLNILFSALLLVALSSCGKIPEAYRGTFVDQPSGTKLTLGSSDGKMTETSGREISASADSLQFDSLSQAKAGLYLAPVQGNDKLLDVMWIVPDASSRQELQGAVWYNAEILNTRMVADAKDPVPSITVEHCRAGIVQLDMASKTWIRGCTADTVPMVFTRVKE